MSASTQGLWWVSVLVLMAMAVLTLTAALFDPRTIDGVNVWAKPLKFELSLAIHFATLALIVGSLGPTTRDGAWLKWIAVAAVISAAYEIGYIVLQAARQQPSHFNVGTPLYAALYTAMAAGAVIITAAAAAVGLAAIVDQQARLGLATRWGIVIGLAGGTVLTLVIAFRMGGSLTHLVGPEPAGAARMPLTGWSLAVGDRRVPHFFATHLMQFGPLAGLLADIALPRMAALMLTIAVTLGWTAMTWFLFQQANAGQPILRWAGPIAP